MRTALPRRLTKPGLLILAVGLVVAACGAHHATGESQSSTTAQSSVPSSGTAGSTATTAAPSGTSHPPAPLAAATSGRPYWLLEDFSVQPLLDAGLPTATLQQVFNNSRTFLIVKPGHTTQDALLPSATRVASFSSLRLLQTALSTAGGLPAGTKYVLYDNERWAATPTNEQQQPFSSAAQAETLAHQHGLGLIFTPAADLATVANAAYAGLNRFTGYLTLDIPAQGARYADVFDIQGQQIEGQSDFASFMSTAIAQVHSANPNALVIAGLTTVDPKAKTTGQLIMQAYDSIRSEVSGYWLNVVGGPSGPKNPGAAVQFLEQLAPELG